MSFMKVDTNILNAKIVFPTQIIEGGISIKDGTIVSIGKEPHLPSANKRIDIKGKLLIPGAIDAHVHISAESRLPGGEDFLSCTSAAAVGGVTLIGIMPNTKILTEHRASFLKNRAAFDGKGVIDYSLLGAFSGGENKDFSKFIPELWEEGAIAIKGYMHNHRPHRKLKASYDGEMLWALEQIAKVGAIANVHCENEWMQEWNRNRIMAGESRDAEAFLKFAPPIVEYEAGIRFLYYCKITGARGMMVHTSLPELVMEAEKGKKEGHPHHVETCPHYLYFSEDSLREKGVWVRCAPTLRDKARVRKMWEMIDKGYVDTLASDHVPSSRDVMEKAQAEQNFFQAGGGLPNIEHLVNSLMNGVNEGWANLFNVVSIITERPAKIYGLYPKKGIIQVGSDADLVAIDMNKVTKIRSENLVTKAGWSSFEGMRFKGSPVLTLVRGEIIAQDGKPVGKAGFGEFVPRIGSRPTSRK